MRYSVIMPTYNRAKFLTRSITSVVKQDCIDSNNIELVVIDDGSEDNTEHVVNSLKQKFNNIKYIKLGHIGQPGTVRNEGLKQSTGDYIAYCDSDDYWLPHHLATAQQYFKKNLDVYMVSNYWGLASFNVIGDNIQTNIVVPPHPKWAVNTNCRVHKKECIDKIGDFNTSRWGEDGDFFTRIENNFKHLKTGIVTSVNGYIKNGNNLTYQFDANVKRSYY